MRNAIFQCVFLLTHPVRGATIIPNFTFYHYVISTHAPRERCDTCAERKKVRKRISTHAPRERCDFPMLRCGDGMKISTHAPRERCDLIPFNKRTESEQFLLTHPVRGATEGDDEQDKKLKNFYSRTP